MSTQPALRPLAEAFPAVRAWLEGEREAEPPRTRADLVAEAFGLDAFGRNLLLLGAYAMLEPEGAERIAELQGERRRNLPSLGLALARLPGGNWSAITASAPLRAQALIATSLGETVAGAAYSLPESVIFALLGAPALAEELAGQSRTPMPPEALAPARERLAEAIAARLAAGRRDLIQLCGPDPIGKEQAAAAAARRCGLALHLIPWPMIPAAPAEIVRLAQLWRRDLRLTGGRLMVDAAGVTDLAPLALFAEAVEEPLIVAAPEPLALGRRVATRLDMARPSAAEQRPIWEATLRPYAGALNGSVERLASHFLVSPELAESVAAELALAGDDADLGATAWDAARRYARPRMEDLARRIDSGARWEDLVLPPAQLRTLRAIAAQVRNRGRVYEEWGFARRAGGRGLGVSALFSGPSGAGKTLAGEILGAELGLDVFRVDLSAIVSKWIGETEKNLRRVFDAAEEGCAILQFDEADALFGKRSEVKDSHDRHANIEVSYLLQRLEEYRGLSILTTNFRSNIDSAFLRRLRFIVEFNFPDQEERARIWRGIFPAQTPLAGLDYARLAQLNLAGGSIRNIAMSAAFLAAEDGAEVGMRQILAAARLEYEKSGRILTNAELRGWPA